MSIGNGITLAAALAYSRAGISILPIKRDGSKAPALAGWKDYQARLPTDEEVTQWFQGDEPPGIGTICGAISGNLELIDFDHDAEEIFPKWQGLVETAAPDLLSCLNIVRTPTGGYHVRYRVDCEVPGNRKLARTEAGHTLIETRGTGGYCLAPGCPPECHKTGRTYEHFSGPKLSRLHTVNAAERDVMHQAASGFDRKKKRAAAKPASAAPRAGNVIDRARKYLEKIPAAVSGCAGHAQTFEAARAMVYGFDLGADAGFDLLMAHYNPRCQPPWTEAELRHKCQDADTRPFDKPRGWLLSENRNGYQPHAQGDVSEPPPPDPDEEAARWANVEKEAGAHADEDEEAFLTDRGNGQRMIAAHGADLRFCWPWRKWLAWDGTRWEPDATGQVMRWQKMSVRLLYRLAVAKLGDLAKKIEECPDDDEGKLKLQAALKLAKSQVAFAIKSEATPRLKAAVESAQSEGGIAILPKELDADSWLLNCRNGTVDLRTGQLHMHRREDCLTKICPVDFLPDAKCPLWEKSLRRWMDDNQDMVGYLQRAAGYSATGSVREQCLFFLHGAGANGKSTFLWVLLNILGDYACQAISDLLTMRNGESHPTERADLFGRRLVAVIETEDGRRMAEALVKQITGGDKIRARRMREDFWEFDPTHKLFLAANHKPVIRGTDYAIWRRIRMVPFTVTIADEEKDPDLPAKLAAESPGILAWIVRGALEWQRTGLADPEEVRAATDAYRAEQDVISDFLTECCVTGPDYRSRASVLYGRFQKWCEESGEREMSKKKFCQELQARGHEQFMSNGSWYRNVMVRVETTE